MTNFEWIQSLDVKRLAQFLCSRTDCATCFASEHCSFCCNGMVAWLKAGNENEERKTDEKN